MIGQGRPTPLGLSFSCREAYPGRGWWSFLGGLVLFLCVAGVEWAVVLGETVGLRVSWGGAQAKRWAGKISLTQGQILSWYPIGTEVDEPGSIFAEDNVLTIAPRTPRTYQGVDLVLDCPDDTSLQIEILSDQGTPQVWSVPLKNVIQQPFQQPLDEQGNRLLVERQPGDELAIITERPHLIFEPGELWKFQVQLRATPFARGSRVTLEIQVHRARSVDREARGPLLDSLALNRGEPSLVPPRRYDVIIAPDISQSCEITLPEAEGVYEVVVTAAGGNSFRLADSVVRPLGWAAPVLQRRVQVVVLRTVPLHEGLEKKVEMKLLGEAVDASHPSFWDRLGRVSPALPKLNLLPREGLLGRGWRRNRESDQPSVSELGPCLPGEEPSWSLFSLPVDEPGNPHLLEIEWPADRKQTLLLAMIEPNAMGAIAPPLVDLGVTASGEASQWGDSPGWQVHRVVFWPRGREPLLLVANPAQEPASYRRIRVYSLGRRLPEYFPPAAFPSERVIAAYFHRPMLSALFGATDAPGPFRQQGIDDWVTFFEASSRLSEYLRYAGYNAVVLSVAADGSALFPSPRWQPTPRHDTGCFSPAGSDPIRKDILELMLRLADRDGFLVIPALDFSTPLPELEAAIRRRGDRGQTLRWIGPDGRAWNDVNPPYRGMGIYYNILHREVQEHILSLIHEFADRYGNHSSFAGLALQISAYGYLQLPGPEWGLDDETVGRFCEETGINLETAANNRFAERARLLLGPYAREWLRWRSQRLQSFYTRVNQELAAVRPDARLYLLTPTLFVGDRWENRLRPTLNQRPEPLAVFQELGLNPAALGTDPSIAFLRVHRVVEHAPLNLRATEFEIDQLYRAWQGSSLMGAPGVLFYQAPREIRLPSFDAASPYSPTLTAIIHQPVPWGFEGRRRYARALAEGDVPFIVDGGWRPSLGDEEALRAMRAAFRRLPALAFRDVQPAGSGKSLQPVVMRLATREQETFVYLVNQAGFPVRVGLRFRAPPATRVLELSGFRPISPVEKDGPEGCRWELQLEPYDLFAFKLTSAQVIFTEIDVVYSQQVVQRLREQINELSERAATLSTPPPFPGPPNADFEASPTGAGEIPFWTVLSESKDAAQLDNQERYQGQRSLKLASRGAPVSVVSAPFSPPPTGRITVAMWLKTRSAAAQPPLRFYLFTQQNQPPFFARYAEIGLSSSGQPAPRINEDWTPVLVEVSDLPLSGTGPLYLRLDLAGPGEVWVDDIQLCSLAFSKVERVELFKLIAPAQAKLENGEIADCLRLLEGYWPKYLQEFVPRADLSRQITREGPPPEKHPAGSSNDPTKTGDRSASLLDRLRSALPAPLRF